MNNNNEIEYIKDDDSSQDDDYNLVSEDELSDASPLSEEIENKLKEAESNNDSSSSSDSSITNDYDTEDTDYLFNQNTETTRDSENNNQIGGSTENKYDYIIPLCMSGFLLSTFYICRK